MPRSSRFPIKWSIRLSLALLSLSLTAQTHTVETGKTITIDVRGVTAAYSLDPSCAEAEAQDGVITIAARVHGKTHVVAVTPDGTQTLEIVVVDPAVKRFRPGVDPFLLPLGAEYGSFSTRYESTSNQLQSEIDLSRRQNQTTIRAHVVTTRILGALSSGESRMGIPSASYEFSTPNRDITVLDRYLDESPLAVTGSIVRGIHYREGDWYLHAGYTSVASFEGLLLPTRPEEVIEAGYRRRLTAHSSLAGTFYDFFVPASDKVGRSGTVALLSYAYTPREGFHINVETGWSRGAAASARLEYRGNRDNLRGSIRYAPATFAGLGSNNLKGFHADLTWTRQLAGALSSDLSFYDNKIMLPGIEQTTLNAAVRMQYRIGNHWSLFGGGTASSYSTAVPPRPPVRNLNAPAGLGFNSRHFGGQAQYQFSRTTQQDSGGRQLRFTINTGAGPLGVSAFAEQQTQAPTLSFVLSQTPGLQQAFDLLGIQATSMQAVNEILRENADLFAAGYIQAAAINLTPRRRQAGGSLSLTGHGSWPQITYNFIYNQNSTLTANTLSAIHSLVYTQRLGPEDISLSYSLVGLKAPGMASSYKPMLALGWRHETRAVPSFIIPEHRGSITGVVFRDDESKGVYEPGMKFIEGASVVLDGVRRVETRADGSFRFAGVHPGKHHLAVSYKSSKPTFFTTQSELDIGENAAVNFGIGFSLSGLGGRIANDTGQGIPGVAVRIHNLEQRWTVSSDSDGRFFLRQLQEGDYEVAVDEDSAPPGYLTSELAPQTVKVSVSEPGRVEFQMTALRSIAGRVITFDKAARKVVPVARIPVQLLETGKVSITDPLGQYVFRGLKPGSYTVAAKAASHDVKRSANLPPTPLALANIDLQLDEALPPGSDRAPQLQDLPIAPPPALPFTPIEIGTPVDPSYEAAPGPKKPAQPPGKSAEEYELSGRRYTSSGRYEEAIADLNEGIRLDPRRATAYNARGFAWFKLRQLRRALDDFDRAIELDPKYANAYRNRAAARQAAGDLPGARADRRRETGSR